MLRKSATSLRVTARSFESSQHRTLTAMSKPRNISSSAPRRNTVPPGYKEDPGAGPMLRFEASLPHLPVPPLASTAAKYLESVQPHLTAEQLSKTQAAVKAFMDSAQSKELQARLEARAREPGMRSWLADWWNEAAYMGYRDPVVVYVSYFYVHVEDKHRPSQAKRAAHLLKAMLPFRYIVESKQLEPEKVRGAPLAMESYKYLFHSSRYPVKPSDKAEKFDPTAHNHVVFVRKNKFYKVPLADKSGRELTAAELEAQIEKVVALAGSEKAAPVGALTSENRDTWADARAALLAASPSNAASLEEIESAMVVVCLDDFAPITREDASWACWVGDGRNRFYDKHQLIVFENGKSGFLGEHSCMDGTPTLRMNEFMLASLAAGKIDLGPARTAETAKDLEAPKELAFVLDSNTNRYVKEAEKNFDDLVGKHDMHVLHYEGYGKEYIKRFKASPDAWAQLVKQLAFHKMYNRPGVCYESAQTRKYQRGRTEVIRAASNESKAWAEAMLNPSESDEKRAALFRKAVARHLQYAAWAADGQGVDRHLFGLKMMLKEGEPTPPIYTDEAFSKTNHWELSTSNLSSPFLDGWGYGEVVPDGYGLSYSIGDEYIRWTITSLQRRTADLKHYIAEAATETRQMMERAAAAEASKQGDGKAKL
ncbi:acyltransferase ChoActase/COT/CPT [Fomitopsis serialis]|uniref:acyltransferase ChoActase/COT/CPT n=1 Tax=Fomitopsis serialis TaxID=139415 RepID=UPI002007B5F4|nr:acyltransferase ChoActase/COT/CPT [Neoantrodia serialis]KAH9936124.1 acyltransferase ChoActase/COT/CPT [Neoantrodia serialis]